MANWLESVCWDTHANDWTPPLAGLSRVLVQNKDGKMITNSVLEALRLNSPYILEGKDKSFRYQLKSELSVADVGAVDLRLFANTLLKFDINSLMHGVFIAKPDVGGGRMRLPRAFRSVSMKLREKFHLNVCGRTGFPSSFTSCSHCFSLSRTPKGDAIDIIL